MYSLVLLAVTSFATPVLYFPAGALWLAYGTLLIASFAVYLASVGWAISRGSLSAPEGSDSDSSDGDSSSNGDINSNSGSDADVENATSTTPLLPRRRTLLPHITHLLLGFLAICLSGYVLSHAASSIVDQLSLSDVLFGVVVLAIATTLPEKFVAVMSARRGYAGVLVASTAGSNIFLLTLCAGIAVLDTRGVFPQGSVGAVELGVLWGSTVAFAATVWFGVRFGAWIGGAMLVAYVVFVGIEFGVVRG